MTEFCRLPVLRESQRRECKMSPPWCVLKEPGRITWTVFFFFHLFFYSSSGSILAEKQNKTQPFHFNSAARSGLFYGFTKVPFSSGKQTNKIPRIFIYLFIWNLEYIIVRQHQVLIKNNKKPHYPPLKYQAFPALS